MRVKEYFGMLQSSRVYKHLATQTWRTRESDNKRFSEILSVVEDPVHQQYHLRFISMSTQEPDRISSEITDIKKVDNEYIVDTPDETHKIFTNDSHLSGQLEDLLEKK